MTQGFETVLMQLADESRPVRSIDLHALSDVPRERAVGFTAMWNALTPVRRLQLLREMVEQAETHVDLNFHVALRALLTDTDPQVRRLAIEGLWEDERVNLIAPLAEMLIADPDAGTRAAAATSLGRFVYLGETDEIADRHAERAENALLDAWLRRGEVNEVRRRALESLAYTSSQGLNDMIRNAYFDEDELMRQSAVFAMGRTGDSRWAKLVIEETDSPDPAMRFEAAQAAGEMGLKPATPLLIRMLDDPDANVREAAIAALGKIGGPAAKRALQALLRSEDEAITQAADDALAELNFISSVSEEMPLTPRAAADGDEDDADEAAAEYDEEDDDFALIDPDAYDDEYEDAYADGDEDLGEDEEDLIWDEDEDEEEDGEDY